MAARTKARKRALDVLFECELRSVPLGDTLAERIESGEPPVNPYTIQLVEGVRDNLGRIDAVLAEHSVAWPLARMPGVDRNLLRIAAYEVLYLDDVPDPVAVSEAVNLAAELSTDESPGFINGLLSRIVEIKATLAP